MKTSELTGAALDWAVAKAEGWSHETDSRTTDLWLWRPFGNHGANETAWLSERRYSTDWSQGGPIIEREKIDTAWSEEGWYANMYWRGLDVVPGGVAGESLRAIGDGPTPLIAAMRCFVASKLGDEVDVPKELL